MTPTAFPTNYWDIHTFTPQGGEIIIVGDNVWSKKTSAENWQILTLKEFFGTDFPLEAEIEEKSKIESELSKNKYSKIKDKVLNELRSFMRPELINRFDDTIIFEPLRYQDMLLIAELQFKLLKKLLEDQSVGFSWTKNAVKEIVHQGFDPIYGARPLKRTIQRLIENPISSLIIDKKLVESNLLLVDFDGENFVFNIQKIELIPQSQLDNQKKRKFICQTCAAITETEIVNNAISICNQCGSSNLQEMATQVDKETNKQTITDKLPDQPKPINPNDSPVSTNPTVISDKSNILNAKPDVDKTDNIQSQPINNK